MLLYLIICYAVSCINHTNDPSVCQIQEQASQPYQLQCRLCKSLLLVQYLSIEMLQLSILGQKKNP